jgi:hypothetical protein
MDILGCRMDLYHTFYPLCTKLRSHHAFKHSSVSIRSSPKEFFQCSELLALLKSLSHSQEVTTKIEFIFLPREPNFPRNIVSSPSTER